MVHPITTISAFKSEQTVEGLSDSDNMNINTMDNNGSGNNAGGDLDDYASGNLDDDASSSSSSSSRNSDLYVNSNSNRGNNLASSKCFLCSI